MRLSSASFVDQHPLPQQFALAAPDEAHHFHLSANRNPHLSWDGIPAGTRTFTLICRDADAPSVAHDVNRASRVVPASLPRVDFFHWVIIEIPASVREINAGECSNGLIAHGKQLPPGPMGARQGLNDYTQWFDSDPQMRGFYHGYDGPCPPWNDMRVHHYSFEVYATELAHLNLVGNFTAPQVLAALQGHVLDQASITATYTLNPVAV